MAALPLTEWNYKTEGGQVTHIGPIAEALREAFPLGTNNKSITTVDADTLRLAAIKGLNENPGRGTRRNAELNSRLENWSSH